MLNLLLALSLGMVIGWSSHSFFMQLTPISMNKKEFKLPLVTSSQIPKVSIVKKTEEKVEKRLDQEKKILTTPVVSIDGFYELLASNLFSDAMALYVDAREIQLDDYRITLLDYFKEKKKKYPEITLEEMIEYQELEQEEKRVDLELLYDIDDNNYEEKAKELLRLIEEKITKTNEYTYAIALKKFGEHFTVNVTIEGIPLTLLLDTGATFTLVNESKLFSLQVINENLKLNTAGGMINAQLVEASRFSLEDIELEKFQLVLANFTQKNVDGLLGMNFFKQFKFKIDQDKSILYLSTNEN